MKVVRLTAATASNPKLPKSCNLRHRPVCAIHLFLVITALQIFLSVTGSSSATFHSEEISDRGLLTNSSTVNSSAPLLRQDQAVRLYRKYKIRGNGDIDTIQSPAGCVDSDSTAVARHRQKRELYADAGGCTDRDIGILQSRDTSGGVPQFIVQIYNTCSNNCEPSDVHVNCEWFASKVVVNPGVFRRVAFNDCLVNAGRPIPRGQILRFTYQNSFMYRLSFKSAKFC